MAAERRFDALVFDLDGVLVDTEQTLYDVWMDVFADFGATFARHEWQSLLGTTDGESPYEWLIRRASVPIPALAELSALAHAREMSAIEHLEAMPGVVAWIDEAEDMGLGLAVASSSPRDWVESRLDQIGLLKRFTDILCPTGELRAKPAPDLYLAAAAALDVDPVRAVAIEDSMNGVVAARTAGYVCIAVPNTLTIDMDLSQAHYTMSSLADGSTADVLARLDPQQPIR